MTPNEPHSPENGQPITLPASPQARRRPHNAPVLAANAEIEPFAVPAAPFEAFTSPRQPRCRPDQHTSEAGADCQGQPGSAQRSWPHSGGLDRPRRRSYHATNPSLPSIHYPAMTPGTGCELHAQVSEKDSDTGHQGQTTAVIGDRAILDRGASRAQP